MQRSKRTTITGLNGVPRLIVGSLSKRTFQGEALVKSARARDSRCRSRVKFNLFSKYWYYTTRRPPFSDHSLFESFESIMARFKEFCQILLLLLPCQSYFWWRLYNLLRVVFFTNSRFCLRKQSVRLGWNKRRWMQGRIWSNKMPYLQNILYLLQK